MVRRNYWLGLCLLSVVVLFSCGGGANESYVPKPQAYPRMALPSKAYQPYSVSDLPMQFEMPAYARMLADTNLEGKHTPGWYNLHFPQFDMTLHLTYYKFNDWAFFDSLLYDSRKLVNKHLQKADDILERPTASLNPEAKGLIFSIQGNTATNFNFYLTDSIQHFVRGALYFNQRTEPDSVAPVFQFVEQDVYHMIKTMRWKK
ncbi:MAG: gliding motility lipoprotein GldD [Bacteroidetes bacterium]|nr:gliding motility lipoprotein GldD [Bacteroidota bacterium]